LKTVGGMFFRRKWTAKSPMNKKKGESYWYEEGDCGRTGRHRSLSRPLSERTNKRTDRWTRENEREKFEGRQLEIVHFSALSLLLFNLVSSCEIAFSRVICLPRRYSSFSNWTFLPLTNTILVVNDVFHAVCLKFLELTLQSCFHTTFNRERNVFLNHPLCDIFVSGCFLLLLCLEPPLALVALLHKTPIEREKGRDRNERVAFAWISYSWHDTVIHMRP
jgi:hypothetical protein